jgi:hypothetical protein
LISLLNGARIGAQEPVTASWPDYDFSAAPEFIELAESAGLEPDPWQKFVLTHGLGQTEDDDWTAKRAALWVPRQNGKGGVIEVLELGWMFLTKEDLVIHSAHQHKTAMRAYVRLRKIIQNAPHLHRRVKAYREAHGEQAIELKDGRLLQYATRSRTALVGFSAPKVVLDEAQELTGEQVGAIMPTVSAMPKSQIWFFGTPPAAPDAWVYGLHEDGAAGKPRLAHFDWGIRFDPTTEEGRREMLAPATWYRSNPALGIRIEQTTVEDEAAPSGLGDLFAQQRLGYWLPRARKGGGPISEAAWRAQADPLTRRPEEIVIAVQVAYDRSRTAIVACGSRAAADGGGLLVMVVDYRPGTHWVVERLAELKARWSPVAIVAQDKGPTGSLLDAMKVAGLAPAADRKKPKPGEVRIPWSDDVADGFGKFVDAVAQQRLWHLDDGPLNQAVAAAGTRSLGGATAWDYRATVDVSPLLAATLAVWGWESQPAPEVRRSAYEDEGLVVV